MEAASSQPHTGSQNKTQVPHIRIVPHIVDVRDCLYFDVIDRDVPEKQILKVGRFTEKAGAQNTRIAFKSKVVSRSHAEIWTENNLFFIKDIKSSSGTFLNHIRLSPPGIESRSFPLKDGDILQLGVDYQGGIKDIYKCVKIRVEINRNWQHNKDNEFRQQVLKNIQNSLYTAGNSKKDKNECCICLYSMSAFQALFVAPCSHSFHFKCVKQLLFTSSGFNCPICRTYADLEASVEIEETDMPLLQQEGAPPDQVHPIQDPSDSNSTTQPTSAPNPVLCADLNDVQIPAPEMSEIANAIVIDPTENSSADDVEMAESTDLQNRSDLNATPISNTLLTVGNVDSSVSTPVEAQSPGNEHFFDTITRS